MSCQIFDEIYYKCINDTVEHINVERDLEAERERRIKLMVEITVEAAFNELIDAETDDAHARQRVSKKLFAKHSVSQTETPPVTLATVIVQ